MVWYWGNCLCHQKFHINSFIDKGSMADESIPMILHGEAAAVDVVNPFLYLFHCKHKHFLVSLHPKNSTEGLTHSSCSQSLFQLTGLSRQAPSLLWSPAPPHSFLWLLHQTDSRACSTCFSHNWLCDPIDYSPLGSSVHGISHVHGMEWVAMPSSRGSS